MCSIVSKYTFLIAVYFVTFGSSLFIRQMAVVFGRANSLTKYPFRVERRHVRPKLTENKINSHFRYEEKSSLEHYLRQRQKT